MLQSNHLIMQLFEMGVGGVGGVVSKVIKDFSHGRLAAEYGAMSKKKQVTIKKAQ